MTDSSGVHEGPPIAVILHERLGNWARQHCGLGCTDLPVRWFETRSAADLAGAIDGPASPVVVIDLGKDPAGPLEDLARVVARDVVGPGPGDRCRGPRGGQGAGPRAGRDARRLGLRPPPEVAELVRDRWRWRRPKPRTAGWSRPMPVDPAKHPMEWIEGLIARPTPPAAHSGRAPRRTTPSRRDRVSLQWTQTTGSIVDDPINLVAEPSRSGDHARCSARPIRAHREGRARRLEGGQGPRPAAATWSTWG